MASCISSVIAEKLASPMDDEPGSMAWHDDPPSTTETIYTQTKEFDPPTFEVDTQRVKAVLVYRRLMRVSALTGPAHALIK